MTLPLLFDHPNLEPVRFRSGRQGYVLQEPWSYSWQVIDNGVKVERELRFPQGFLSDGASVPRLLWTCTGLTPDGLIRGPAFVHDALYRFRGYVPAGWLFERPRVTDPAVIMGWLEVSAAKRHYDRLYADRVFRRLMNVVEMDPVQIFLAYHGVRLNRHAWRRPVASLELAEAQL